MSMMLRRQMLMQGIPHVIIGSGLNGDGEIVYDANLFRTEPIPVSFENSIFNLQFAYSNGGTLETLTGVTGLAGLYQMKKDHTKVDYWAANNESGIRTVTVQAAKAGYTKLIVLTGYLPDIQYCFVKDFTHNVMLWEPGM